MKKVSLVVVFAVVLGGVAVMRASAHCQVPCGIYGDNARIVMLEEHIGTIEKSMKKIVALSANPKANQNQLVRWVNNKDEHAKKIDEIITYYFMAQRIKPAPEKDKKATAAYVEKLTLLHKMLVVSMKTKQTTDLAQVKKFRDLLNAFKKAY